jgi:hypothetical protein
MVWLVKTNVTSTGQPDPGHRTPPCFFHFRTADALFLERHYQCLQIGAHQIELVPDISFGGMDGQFRRRQREDEPTVPRVNGRKTKDLLEEGPISRRISAVNDHVGTKDHELAPLAPIILQSRSLPKLAGTVTEVEIV